MWGKGELTPKVGAMGKEDLDTGWCEAGIPPALVRASGSPETRICIDKRSGWRARMRERDGETRKSG